MLGIKFYFAGQFFISIYFSKRLFSYTIATRHQNTVFKISECSQIDGHSYCIEQKNNTFCFDWPTASIVLFNEDKMVCIVSMSPIIFDIVEFTSGKKLFVLE